MNRKYYAKNKDRLNDKVAEWQKAHLADTYDRRVNNMLQKKYGITFAEREAMIQKQNDTCPICKGGLDKPHVDHCHDSGEVRGILCRSCNLILGYAKDDIDTLVRAIAYLQQFNDRV
jgi:hypothetical protein